MGMRLVSQDGNIDAPYEMTALHQCAGIIRMNMAGDTGKGTIMAQYSTEGKARKALDMLHKAYLGLFLANNIEMPEDFSEQIKNIVARGYGVVVIDNKHGNASFSPLNTV